MYAPPGENQETPIHPTERPSDLSSIFRQVIGMWVAVLRRCGVLCKVCLRAVRVDALCDELQHAFQVLLRKPRRTSWPVVRLGPVRRRTRVPRADVTPSTQNRMRLRGLVVHRAGLRLRVVAKPGAVLPVAGRDHGCDDGDDACRLRVRAPVRFR
ncbi:hypothetical protein EXIGLDRAFT_345932 [Exidia glandulosa HHB12029]|uniref:Uncharacterized protein n=1 Tax=Exidia glandulosa HHB12029 TaxID=1314781 RepID=A0A165CGI6_EXIGL|nr:hypothetical protein EXIGLDRAFT_345932 [Exidia glandulosa HHB12029]